MNIDEVLAGRELDALVAEKVMGWTRIHRLNQSGDFCGVPPQGAPPYVLPCYSTDIAAAWEITERLRLIVGPCSDGTNDLWFATRPNSVTIIPSTAKTAPLAICRAALKLMEGK